MTAIVFPPPDVVVRHSCSEDILVSVHIHTGNEHSLWHAASALWALNLTPALGLRSAQLSSDPSQSRSHLHHHAWPVSLRSAQPLEMTVIRHGLCSEDDARVIALAASQNG